jgi:PAS domain-containing protein
MTAPQIDYRMVFQRIPLPLLVLTPGFVIADMNEAYLRAAGRSRDQLLGRDVFAAFPDNPADPEATGVHNLRSSLRRVLNTGKRDVMAVQKYDVAVSGGGFEQRYWIPVNAPVPGPDGEVAWIRLPRPAAAPRPAPSRPACRTRTAAAGTSSRSPAPARSGPR